MRGLTGLAGALIVLVAGIAAETRPASAQEAAPAAEDSRPITFHVAGFT